MFHARHTAVAVWMICSVLCFGARAESSTYYVSPVGSDRGAGTWQEPFQTIQRGLGFLHPGDTLYIRAGTYIESILETSFGATGTSWSSFVTVSGYPGEIVTLKPTGGPGNVVRFQDGSIHHVLLQDLILDGINAGGGGSASVISTAPASHDEHFNRVEVRNGDDNGVLGYGRAHEFRAMDVHTNGTVGSAGGANGMYLAFDSSTIIGGTFHDNLCYGIRIWDSAHPAHSATGNVVNRALIYNNGTGKGLGGAAICPTDGGGLTIGDINNTVKNSVVYNNFWGSYDQFAHGNGNYYYNNTFYNNVHGITLNANNTAFQNNISYMSGDNNLTNTGAGNTVDHNLGADPRFTNPASHDFSVKAGSPAINAGITILSVIDDFLGATRTSGAYDIGAVDFSALASTRPMAPKGLIVVR